MGGEHQFMDLFDTLMIWWWGRLNLLELGTTSELCCMCAKIAAATKSEEARSAQGGK